MAEFQCPYADAGQSRCSPAICDCFIEQYPDDPFGLHPEAFMVKTENGWFRPAPIGWHQFGTHVDQDVRLEFSEETDEAGMPLWERPVESGKGKDA